MTTFYQEYHQFVHRQSHKISKTGSPIFLANTSLSSAQTPKAEMFYPVTAYPTYSLIHHWSASSSQTGSVMADSGITLSVKDSSTSQLLELWTQGGWQGLSLDKASTVWWSLKYMQTLQHWHKPCRNNIQTINISWWREGYLVVMAGVVCVCVCVCVCVNIRITFTKKWKMTYTHQNLTRISLQNMKLTI